MKFCQKCGTKMEDIAAFCPECGARIIDESTVQSYKTPYVKGMKAAGGLKIWLWILMVSGGIGVVTYLFLAYQYRWLGASISFILLAVAVLLMFEIYGAYRLLNGQKVGFYIIAGCIGASVIINYVNQGINGVFLGFILGAIALGILWAFASKQWEYFE